MANIVISELRPVGIELFDGSESFMSDLNDSELDLTKGGMTPVLIPFLAFEAGVFIGISISAVINH